MYMYTNLIIPIQIPRNITETQVPQPLRRTLNMRILKTNLQYQLL